jgi:acetaldehyde dehydrogenase (acetylating)
MTNRLPLIVNAGAGQIEELAASDNLSLGNSSIVDANVVSATYLYGDGSNITNLPAGNYSNANVANYLPTYTGNLSSLTGNVTTTGNIQGNYILGDGSQLTNLPAGDYSNANVDSHLDGSAGNIIPVGNNAQSLGNATNQWSDLWVSNSTIYMNSVPITLGAGNVLTVNGEALLSNDSDTSITTTGNITAGNVTVAGNSLTWPNASIVQTSASDFSITGDGQVTVRSLDGTYQWTFDSNGNLSAPGNINTSANVTANYFIGDGSQLTNLPVQPGTYSNADVANYLPTYSGNLTSLTGDVTTSANVQANYFIGNGSQLTDIVSSYGDSNVANYLPTYTGNLVSLTGDVTTVANISGNYIIGDGSQLTNLPVQPGTYSNANVANYLPTYSGNLASLTGNVTTTANISGNFILGDGSQLTNLPVQPGTYSNANVANYLPTYSGNLASLTGNVTTTANIQANFIIGNGSQLIGIVSSYGDSNVANYLPTYSGNLTSLTGNVTTTANVNSNNITATGNVTANIVTAQQQLVLPTYANTTAANTAIGLANLVAGSTIFTTDAPPTFYGWDGTAWVALS